MHYTLQVVKSGLTWRGVLKYKTLWTEDYDTYPAAWARATALLGEGYQWILHDWETDPGPMPEPAVPGEDIGEDEDWHGRMAMAKLNRQGAHGQDVPF